MTQPFSPTDMSGKICKSAWASIACDNSSLAPCNSANWRAPRRARCAFVGISLEGAFHHVGDPIRLKFQLTADDFFGDGGGKFNQERFGLADNALVFGISLFQHLPRLPDQGLALLSRFRFGLGDPSISVFLPLPISVCATASSSRRFSSHHRSISLRLQP